MKIFSNVMINVLVIFGNHNSYSIELPSSIKLGQLATIFPVLLKIQPEDLLYIMICGHVIGHNVSYGFDKTLSDCPILNDKCVAHLIFKDPKVTYPDIELITSARNQAWLKRQSQTQTQTQTLSNNPFGQILESLAMNLDLSVLQDVAVTIAPEDVDRHLHPLSEDPSTVCGICQDVITVENGVKLTCNHPYHRSCIRNWLVSSSVTCPTCNFDVRNESTH